MGKETTWVVNKPERIGKWNLWSLKKITKPGVYWIAGYFPENKREMYSESSEPEEPTIWEFDEVDDIDTVTLHGYGAENFIWFGPIKPPQFHK